jgi:hypothetical protein
MRRGVVLGLALGSLIGGTAGATILTASEHPENARHAHVQQRPGTAAAQSAAAQSASAQSASTADAAYTPSSAT